MADLYHYLVISQWHFEAINTMTFMYGSELNLPDLLSISVVQARASAHFFPENGVFAIHLLLTLVKIEPHTLPEPVFPLWTILQVEVYDHPKIQ